MQLSADRYGNGCMYRGCIHDGVCTVKGSNMNRDKQEQNTKYFYMALAGLGLLVLIAQFCMYVGYMIGEWLL
jgi:hypothetical protein